MTLQRPTFADVLTAARTIRPLLSKTAFHESVALGRMTGCRLFIKYENHSPVNSFKIRGALNRMMATAPEERLRGFITASMGNHGLGVCFAAKIVEAKATVCVPEKANPDKCEAMRDLGAEVIAWGDDFEAASKNARAIADERGATFLHPHNDFQIIAGHATAALEMFEDEPELETIVVPIGGGTLIAGSALVAKALKPEVKVIGVQAERMPAFYLSRKEGHRIETPPATTFAEGVAVREPPELTFGMVQELVDDIVLVSEEEMRRAILLLLEKTHNLAEGAGAAGVAAVMMIRESLRGQIVGTILSGGNLPWHVLNKALNDSKSW
ncbi:MAG: threonine ammonia-lyase [Actinomycetota bacterium]